MRFNIIILIIMTKTKLVVFCNKGLAVIYKMEALSINVNMTVVECILALIQFVYDYDGLIFMHQEMETTYLQLGHTGILISMSILISKSY